MDCPDINSIKLDRADEEALEEIRRAQRARVSQVAKLRILTGSLSYEQRQFWNAVDNGCGGY